MQIDTVTVGTSVVRLSLTSPPNFQNGLRLLARSANSGNVYVGLSQNITTSSGVNLLPKGDWGATVPYTIPVDYLAAGGQVYLIASSSAQLVDWSAA